MGNTSTILLLISIIFFSSASNAGLIYGISNSGYFIGYDTTTGNSLPAFFQTAFSRDDTLMHIPIAVPEPSTLAIFVLGMIGLISRQFKKQS
jgi:Trk-type K+ transport system membrane component